MKKKLLIAAGIAIILALPFLAKREGKALGVDIHTVALQDIRPSILASGTLAFRTEVKLTSEVLAQVTEILVAEGDRVERGQVLLRLDPETYRNAIEREEASRRQQVIAIERQRVALELRQQQFDRYQKLANMRTVDQARFDEERNQLKLARIELKSSEEALRRADAVLNDARELLDKTEITSPIAGTVVSLPIKVGETAIPSTNALAGAQLMTIADTSAIEARLKVDEGDIARIAIGQNVDVYPAAHPTDAIKGRVERIALVPLVDQQGRAFEVIASLEAREGLQLRSGMSARADVFLGDGTKVLAVPVESVVTSEPEPRKTVHHIWKVVDGKVSKIDIDVGAADDRWQAITKGLAAGDEIVAGPMRALRQLSAGQPVEQQKSESKEQKNDEAGSEEDANEDAP